MNKKTVLLSGPLLTQSGYGIHSRQIARWLLSKEKQYNLNIHMDTTIWGNTPWIVDRNKENGLIGEILDRTGTKKNYYDSAIFCKLPNEVDVSLSRNNILFTA